MSSPGVMEELRAIALELVGPVREDVRALAGRIHALEQHDCGTVRMVAELKRIADALEARNLGAQGVTVTTRPNTATQPHPPTTSYSGDVPRPGLWTDVERARWRLGIGREQGR